MKAQSFTMITLILLLGYSRSQAQTTQAATPKIEPVGTHAILGKINGIAIEGMVQSPSAEVTPLQVICVFEYVEGDIFTSPPALPAAANGLVHVDKQLNGLLTDLRKSGKFAGHSLETLLIIPPKGTIAARRLLLIGLGDRSKFTPALMTDVGHVEMREALRLGVISYAHASDLKDGGLDSPTGEIISDVLKGAMEAYETELYLKAKHATVMKPFAKVTLLAGQPFYDPSGVAVKQFIQSYHK